VPNFAKIYLIGHVGNIKSRFTPNGKQIVSFSVAVNRYRNKTKFTDWYYVDTAQEWLLNELDVGDLVFVEGVPKITETNGRKYMNIWLNKIRILTPKAAGQNEDIEEPEVVDDEIPF